MDILYIHSPITYSIALQMVREGEVRDPLVICGRGLRWPGAHVSVVDDGIWSPERTVEFLIRLVSALPATDHPSHPDRLRVFLPHSGYLLGKFLRLSPVVASIAYLEEGNTSCNAELAQVAQDQAVDTGLLLQLLRQHPTVMARLRLSDADIHALNALPPVWFDGRSPKYAGAYRVSPDAFPTMDQVHTLALAPQPVLADAERNWLCFLPNIINLVAQHGSSSVQSQKLLHGLVIALRTVKAMIADRCDQLVIKFHPVDDANLNPDFKNELFRFGQSYAEFARQQGIDAQLEPTLFNFGRFIVINESAASRYVKLFCGAERLIQLKLD